MPYVNIRIPQEDATPGQKAQLIEGVAQLLSDVLGTDPRTTFVIIDEVPTNNWGIGGETSPYVESSEGKAGKEAPKRRGLPEKLAEYIEQRRQARIEASASDSQGITEKDPPTRGRKKRTAE